LRSIDPHTSPVTGYELFTIARSAIVRSYPSVFKYRRWRCIIRAYSDHRAVIRTIIAMIAPSAPAGICILCK